MIALPRPTTVMLVHIFKSQYICLAITNITTFNLITVPASILEIETVIEESLTELS